MFFIPAFKKLSSFCVALALSFGMYGQAEKGIDSLKKEVTSLLYQDSDSAFKLIERGLKLSSERKDSSSLAFFYLQKGALFNRMDYNKAIEYYFTAKEIYEKSGDKRGIGSACLGMASIKKVSEARKLELLLLALANSENTLDTISVYINLGNYFLDRTSEDSALYYYKKSLKLGYSVGHPIAIAGSYCNIAQVEMNRGNLAEAKDMLYTGIELVPEKTIFYRLDLYHNLMEVYLKLQQEDSVFHYLDIMDDYYNQRPDLAIIAYNALSGHYLDNDDYKNAFLYSNKSDSVKSFMDHKNEDNYLSLLELEYEDRVKKEQMAKLNAEIAQANNTRFFLIILLVLSAIFTVVLTLQQRAKSRKKRHIILQRKKQLEIEQKLTSAELENSELRRKYLDDELKYTNKELTSFATSIVQNHTVISDLKQRVSDLIKEKDKKQSSVKLKELHDILFQISNHHEQRKEFIKKSRQLNHSLIFHLKKTFPQLTEKDTNLLILLFLKFQSKEIGVLYNIETDSVAQKRYRLRKKLGIKNEESFQDFFDTIMQDIPYDTKENKSINTL